MLRFSANLSLLFTEKKLLDRFKQAAEHGFKAVEIQFPYQWPAELIAEQLDACDLKLVLFNVDAADLLQGGPGLASVPEATGQFKDAVEQSLHYAEILKPDAINVLPGRQINSSETTRQIDTLLQNLQMAAKTFSPLGIKTVFEAINTHDMPGFLIHSSSQMLDILTQLQNPMLGMQYDIYHMAAMGEDPNCFIRNHAEQIGHMQFADYPGRGEPGTGLLDFPTLFKTIEQSGYQGWVGAEYRPKVNSDSSLEWLRDHCQATN